MVALIRATSADIAFIMATERRPGYEDLVGRFPQDEHRANLADDNWLYFIGLDDNGVAQGFAILQDRNKRDGNEFLRRIAVTDAGGGFGKPFLTALINWVFANGDAQRFWLNVHNNNDRARRVYASLGFVEEGPESEAVHSSTRMALAKSVWLAR
ncbi:MAG TPA: GNAT family N-acetyltransferase [Rhizomicrobium sp.]